MKSKLLKMKIQDLSKELSYDVFDLCNELKNVRREFEVSNQLKRCSTSVAANIQESQSADQPGLPGTTGREESVCRIWKTRPSFRRNHPGR